MSAISSVIVRVRVVFKKTVVGDWRFDNLSGSHLLSQVKSLRQMMVFMPRVVVLIGHQDLKIAVCVYTHSYKCL